MEQFTRYEVSDHLAVELARRYSEEVGEPFMVMVGANPGYDIVSQSQDLKIEIKYESTPIRTGNVALEVYNRDLKCSSGIDSTEANLWLHLVLTQEGFLALEYDVGKLKEIAYQYGHKMSCSYNSVCMLVPLEIFTKHCRRSFLFDTKFYNEMVGD